MTDSESDAEDRAIGPEDSTTSSSQLPPRTVNPEEKEEDTSSSSEENKEYTSSSEENKEYTSSFQRAAEFNGWKFNQWEYNPFDKGQNIVAVLMTLKAFYADEDSTARRPHAQSLSDGEMEYAEQLDATRPICTGSFGLLWIGSSLHQTQ